MSNSGPCLSTTQRLTSAVARHEGGTYSSFVADVVKLLGVKGLEHFPRSRVAELALSDTAGKKRGNPGSDMVESERTVYVCTRGGYALSQLLTRRIGRSHRRGRRHRMR